MCWHAPRMPAPHACGLPVMSSRCIIAHTQHVTLQTKLMATAAYIYDHTVRRRHHFAHTRAQQWQTWTLTATLEGIIGWAEGAVCRRQSRLAKYRVLNGAYIQERRQVHQMREQGELLSASGGQPPAWRRAGPEGCPGSPRCPAHSATCSARLAPLWQTPRCTQVSLLTSHCPAFQPPPIPCDQQTSKKLKCRPKPLSIIVPSIRGRLLSAMDCVATSQGQHNARG